MADITNEMKTSANYAIKWAKDRFGQELDYSEESIGKLNKILERIYWGFSNHTQDEGRKGLVFNTAVIWGSYLGEYMCKMWGGKWISIGSEQLVSIQNFQLSPISFVYQKISSHPEYNLNDYLYELKIKTHMPVVIQKPAQHPVATVNQPKVDDDLFKSRVIKLLTIYNTEPSPQPSEIISQQSQRPSATISQPAHPTSETISHPKINDDLFESKINKSSSVVHSQPSIISSPPKEDITSKHTIKTTPIDKRLLFTFVGISGILLVAFIGIILYKIIKVGGISTAGVIPSTSENSNIPIEKTLVTATPYSTNTQYRTVTPMPTYTSIPTNTPHPTRTAHFTDTLTATSTPTESQTPFPTRTRTRVPSPTSVPNTPVDTPIPPTIPPPTATQQPPVVILSCEVNPSTVPININVPISFIVHFSSPGYGFDTVFDSSYPGQSGCSGSDNGSGIASCDGSSGEIPAGTTASVTLRSSVGDCSISYSSQ